MSSSGSLMNVTLGLDCKANESLFVIHEMFGLGRPVAVQLKVTLAPISVLWFWGTPINSGAGPVRKKYVAINIPFSRVIVTSCNEIVKLLPHCLSLKKRCQGETWGSWTWRSRAAHQRKLCTLLMNENNEQSLGVIWKKLKFLAV